jgi:hypothetical protein
MLQSVIMNTRKIAGFTWDKNNVEKLAVHGLCPDDAENLFDNEPVIFCHPKHADRWVAIGLLPEPDERFVLASFELDEETRWIRVVTAFEPTSEKWWRLYAKAKNIKA